MEREPPEIRLFGEELPDVAGEIRLLVLDVDGVLTDGRIIIDAEGREIKAFHVRDGFGIRLWLRAGLEVAVITGRSSEAVTHRCRDLGIAHVAQGARDKVPALQELLRNLGFSLDEVCVVGDDLPDLPLLLGCRLGVAVADAHEALIEQADIVTGTCGGHGAVREVIELLLEAKGLWDETLEYYTRSID